MASKNVYKEELVSWQVSEYTVHATLTRPENKGSFPAVIFVAGSGPTDRDWNSPMIPGTNGSGALLARELAAQGFITLRYDKGASGPHAAENVKNMAGQVSMKSHIDELAGGAKLLSVDTGVNPARIFVLTNSEGCVHALNYQTANIQPQFAGIVLTSAFARATGDLAHDQVAAQLAAVPGGDAMLAGYDAAMAEFVAGRPVPANENLPAGLQQMIQAISEPFNQPFARELWVFNPIEKLAKITIPVLIVIGKKDIQVDWLTDGPLFDAVAKEHANITIFYSENANHVMKFEPTPRAELTPAMVMSTYSAENVMLDPEPVAQIISWFKALM